MDNPLTPEILRAFGRELEKTAIQFPELRELAKRFGGTSLKGIGEGISRGWEAISPVGLIRQDGEYGEHLHSAVMRTQAAEKALQTGSKVPVMTAHGGPAKSLFGREIGYSGESLPGRARAYLATKLRAGTHLAPEAEPASGLKGMAERASRSGWTGEGAMTKYLPIGQKGMLLTGTLAAAPGIVNAMRYGPSQEHGGVGEQLGTLAGFTLPAILTGGLPNSSFVSPIIGSFAGGRLGRAIDKRLDPRVQAVEGATR